MSGVQHYGNFMSLAQQQLLGGPAGPAQMSSGQSGPPGSHPIGNSGGSWSGPQESEMFSRELEALSTSQLEELLSDEDAFKRFAIRCIGNTPAARALSDIRAQNLALARDSLAMEGAIHEARNHVAIVRGSEYAGAKGAFEDAAGRQAAAMAVAAPSIILAQLTADADKADDAGGALQDAFLRGTLALEPFVEQYVASRTAYHALDLKRQTGDNSQYAQ